MGHLAHALAGLCIAVISSSSAWADSIAISGRITLQPDLASSLEPDDRLVLKLYHPEDGIEKDTRYWIIDNVDLPRDFEIAPSVDMNGKARWRTYRLEVFTDRDGDVLTSAPGELFAITENLVPLGTEGLMLELKPPDS